MSVCFYAQAILRSSHITLFLDDSLLNVCRSIPSDLGFHRDSCRVEISLFWAHIRNHNAAGRAIEERGRVAPMKTRQTKGHATADLPVMSISRGIQRRGTSKRIP